MRLEQRSFNRKEDLKVYVKEHGIKRDDILTYYEEHDGTYTLMYYAE